MPSGDSNSIVEFASNVEGVSRRASSAARRALRADEATRAGAFARALVVLLLLTMASPMWLGGPTWLIVATELSLAGLLGVALWVARVTRDPRRYARRHFRILAVTCVFGAGAALVYLGIFSPTALVITLGISFIATGWDRSFALGAPVFAALGYMVMSAVITLGWVPDFGRLQPAVTSEGARWFFVFVAPTVMLLTARVSRSGREIIFGAIQEAHEAALLAGMREAQLAEVKQDLDAALAAGAGVGGRYTGAKMGNYELGAILGRGAMGEVYLARALDGKDIAAVKLLVQGVQQQPTLVARFRREAEITQDLVSPHVVHVRATGEAPDGTPFIVMERLIGHDLSWHLRRRGRFTLADALMLCEHVAKGLDAAHAAGIIHRDIKPRNLFLAESEGREDEVWKILDFGVSKLRTSEGTLTQSGLVGTPGYMAPEQAAGDAVDERADLFALGAVLFRVLTGRPPFSGAGPVQVLYEVVHRQPQRPTELAPEIPRAVELVLAVALAKSPRHRFATGAQLFNAMRAAAADELPQSLEARARRILKANPWATVTPAFGESDPNEMNEMDENDEDFA